MIDYKKIYDIIAGLTPLKTDCGVLCNCACCKGDEETGMYLFPGEEEYVKEFNADFEICDSDFAYEYEGEAKRVKLFVCKGGCDRKNRPLACRIFPFVAYTDLDGETCVMLDPRAEGLCPLYDNADEAEFDEEFLDALEKAFDEMAEDDEIMTFISAQSELIDEECPFDEE